MLWISAPKCGLFWNFMGLKWLRLPAKAFILENLSVFAISECYRSTFDNEHLRRGHSFESTAVVSLIRLYHLNYCITYWTWAFAPSYHSGRKKRDALVVMACRAKLIFCSRHYRHDACAIASLHLGAPITQCVWKTSAWLQAWPIAASNATLCWIRSKLVHCFWHFVCFNHASSAL